MSTKNSNKVYMISAEDAQKAARHRGNLDKIEDLEHELCQVVIREVEEIVELSNTVNIDRENRELSIELMRKKDSCAKTTLIVQRLAQYTGLKRGILPRELQAPGREPRTDIDKAASLIERYKGIE